MKKPRIPVAAAVPIIIAVAVAAGFLFDLICTAVEYKLYPRDYSEYVKVYSEKYAVPEKIIYAVINTESGFSSSSVSDKGAVGLMQITPDTFSWLTNDMLGEKLDPGMLYDPETNIRYGVYMLSWLYDKYGSWNTVYAAYNAGTGNVDEWLGDSKYTDSFGLLINIPFPETKNYVKKVSSAVLVYERLYYR